MVVGGRGLSSAKPTLPLLSPSAATLSGYSAPQTPGPEIGLIRTNSALSLTAPDFRHAISASARHGSRSAVKNPRPQPTSETRTKEPTRYKRTPRVIRARSTNLFKDSSTHCFHKSLTTPPAVPGVTFSRYSSTADFFRRERFANFSVIAGTT